MAALEKQSSTGKTHQLAQNLDNLQLCDEPLPWDNDCCQFRKPNGSQCGRRKPNDGDFCWQHAAAALKTYHVTITNFSKEIVEVKAKDEEEAEEKALAGNIVKEIAIGDPSQECDVEEVGNAAAAEAAEAAPADEVAAPMTASAAYGFLFQGNNHWDDKTLDEYLTERYVVSYLDAHSFTQVRSLLYSPVLSLTSLIPYTQDGVSLEIDTPDEFPDSLDIKDLFESEYKAMRVLKEFVASNVGKNCDSNSRPIVGTI